MPNHIFSFGPSAPSYMVQNPSVYMHSTLQSCCLRNYNWNYNECMGAVSTGSTTAVTGTNKWYVNYETSKCVQDCSSGATCGGLASAWESLYVSVTECCSRKLYWISPSNCEAASLGTAIVGSNKWYVNYETSSCVQDCEGNAPCGGLAESWETLHTSATECCSQKLSWVNPTTCLNDSQG